MLLEVRNGEWAQLSLYIGQKGLRRFRLAISQRQRRTKRVKATSLAEAESMHTCNGSNVSVTKRGRSHSPVPRGVQQQSRSHRRLSDTGRSKSQAVSTRTASCAASLHAKLKSQLTTMQKDGILEPVTRPTDWISSMVVVVFIQKVYMT